MRKLSCLCLIVLALSIPNWGRGQSNDTADETFPFQAKTDKPLEVLLGVDAGEVIVEKGTEAAAGFVNAKYFKEDHRFKVHFDEKENRLRIRLDKDHWTHIRRDRDDPERRWARIQLVLPFGVEERFDARVKAGEVNMHVGGLRFREFALSTWAGAVNVCFDEPNAIVMDDLDIHAGVGEVRLTKLGNARFKEARIDGGIGEMRIDFSGALENDCRAKVDLDIGETSMLLPQAIGIRVHIGGGWGFLSHKNIDESFYPRGRYYYTEDYDHNEKKMYLLVTPGLGELRIERE